MVRGKCKLYKFEVWIPLKQNMEKNLLIGIQGRLKQPIRISQSPNPLQLRLSLFTSPWMMWHHRELSLVSFFTAGQCGQVNLDTQQSRVKRKLVRFPYGNTIASADLLIIFTDSCTPCYYCSCDARVRFVFSFINHNWAANEIGNPNHCFRTREVGFTCP